MNSQENINQEENNNNISFFNKKLNILGVEVPYWLIILIIVLIIMFILFGISDTQEYEKIRPAYDLFISYDSPKNTAIERIIGKQ